MESNWRADKLEAGWMRKVVKRFAHRFAPRIARAYLKKEKDFHANGMVFSIPEGVFHPGLYFSTQIFVDFLKEKSLKGKKILELGAGSGMISIFCARQGAIVTATDISQQAVEAVRRNAAQNGAELTLLESDLFESIPPQQFDWILVNPPYFPGTPENWEQYAWYCGPEFEYFHRFFQSMGAYLGKEGKAYMILSEDCQLGRIQQIGREYGRKMRLVKRRWKMGEWNYIFEIQ